MRDVTATVELNREIGPGFFRIRLRLPEPVSVLPGQFGMVRPHGLDEPILRRALAVHRVDGRSIEFIYLVLGRGLEALARLTEGDRVDVLLPLGNTYPTAPVLEEGRRALVVGGGVGAPALFMLAEQLVGRGADCRVLFGGRTAGGLPGLDDFEALGCPVTVTTDDGTAGERGFVTAPLERELAGEAPERGWVVYTCGPWPMMARARSIAHERGVPCYVSLEASMACGFGICVACVVEVCEGSFAPPFKYQKVCTEGPVFPAEAIVW
jgi:dihydroorotate dehydrogenase electron transfer subunit